MKFNKQGASKGESPKTERKDWISVLAFNFEVISPRDVATGQASGKRQYKPIRFVKEWGAASPQLLTACARNEQVDSCNFEFIKVNKSGTEYVYHTITLTNATVSACSLFTGEEGGVEGGSTAKHSKETGTHELERISMTFQKVEHANNDGKTMFADDWNTTA